MFGPTFVLLKTYDVPELVWTQNYFGPNIFLAKYFFLTHTFWIKNFLDPTYFGIQIVWEPLFF